MKRLGWGLDPTKIGIPEGMGLTRKQIIDAMQQTMKNSPEFLERFDCEWQRRINGHGGNGKVSQ